MAWPSPEQRRYCQLGIWQIAHDEKTTSRDLAPGETQTDTAAPSFHAIYEQ